MCPIGVTVGRVAFRTIVIVMCTAASYYLSRRHHVDERWWHCIIVILKMHTMRWRSVELCHTLCGDRTSKVQYNISSSSYGRSLCLQFFLVNEECAL